jgi:hypothetical protein
LSSVTRDKKADSLTILLLSFKNKRLGFGECTCC